MAAKLAPILPGTILTRKHGVDGTARVICRMTTGAVMIDEPQAKVRKKLLTLQEAYDIYHVRPPTKLAKVLFHDLF